MSRGTVRGTPLLSSILVCAHYWDLQGEADTSLVNPTLALARGATPTVSTAVPQALLLGPRPLIPVPCAWTQMVHISLGGGLEALPF